MDEADLRGARLGGAFLVDASLRGADLLDGANLSGADLRDAQGLTQAQLVAAHCDIDTRMPAALSEAVFPGRTMAKDEHAGLIKLGAAAWNSWRAEHEEAPDLSGASLRGSI